MYKIPQIDSHSIYNKGPYEVLCVFLNGVGVTVNTLAITGCLVKTI